ncbi:cbb3-type cytochrome c oxidase subunit II [Pseudorhizobium tarimense]|uniref:Cbb3-type cytochrome c oxidase subunit II n=1 Tax=Pseudorhizobium tarimense TaxID=1079109 RepID=A0ABV2H385_9HYPH
MAITASQRNPCTTILSNGDRSVRDQIWRVGDRYSNEWHVQHLIEPRSVVPESVMPGYAFLKDTPLNVTDVTMELKANLAVGVPYAEQMLENAKADLMTQADPNADASGVEERYPKAKIGDFDGNPTVVTEMDALVAYLQMLGTLVDFSTYDDAAGYR